jgi:hypothetical protein
MYFIASLSSHPGAPAGLRCQWVGAGFTFSTSACRNPSGGTDPSMTVHPP